MIFNCTQRVHFLIYVTYSDIQENCSISVIQNNNAWNHIRITWVHHSKRSLVLCQMENEHTVIYREKKYWHTSLYLKHISYKEKFDHKFDCKSMGENNVTLVFKGRELRIFFKEHSIIHHQNWTKKRKEKNGSDRGSRGRGRSGYIDCKNEQTI